MSSVSQWLRMKRALSESDGFEPSSMLCVPIFNGTNDDVIGVAQLINKVRCRSSFGLQAKSKFDPTFQIVEVVIVFSVCGIDTMPKTMIIKPV